MEETVFNHLVHMEEQERVRFVGSGALGVRRMGELTVQQAAKLDELCPAALAGKVLGAEASCEALNRTRGGCKACTERFLRMPWPTQAPDGAFQD